VHCESQLLSPQQHWRLSPINREESLSLLLPWLQACQQAFQGPLPLFTRSSYAFAKALQPSSNSKKDPQQAARDNARTCWEGNEHMAGEQQDPWNALAFRDRPALDEHFEHLAEQLLSPVLERLP
jgi:exodeoxyribonuclease V gamma subunit